MPSWLIEIALIYGKGATLFLVETSAEIRYPKLYKVQVLFFNEIQVLHDHFVSQTIQEKVDGIFIFSPSGGRKLFSSKQNKKRNLLFV